MTTLLILIGSDRDGVNAHLATVASSLLPEGITTEVRHDLARLPHYREELDAAGVDSAVDEFREAVRRANGLLFVTPEYNGGPSSIMKNALDLASRPRQDAAIAGRPVAVIGATPSPGATNSARSALLEGVRRAGGVPVEPSMGIARVTQLPEDYTPEILDSLREVLEALVAAARGA